MDRPPISTPNVLAGLAAVVIIVAGLKAASSLFVPFLLAGFITLLCAPALFWMRDRGLPTPLALIVVLLGLFGIGALFGGLMSDGACSGYLHPSGATVMTGDC